MFGIKIDANCSSNELIEIINNTFSANVVVNCVKHSNANGDVLDAALTWASKRVFLNVNVVNAIFSNSIVDRNMLNSSLWFLEKLEMKSLFLDCALLFINNPNVDSDIIESIMSIYFRKFSFSFSWSNDEKFFRAILNSNGSDNKTIKDLVFKILKNDKIALDFKLKLYKLVLENPKVDSDVVSSVINSCYSLPDYPMQNFKSFCLSFLSSSELSVINDSKFIIKLESYVGISVILEGLLKNKTANSDILAFAYNYYLSGLYDICVKSSIDWYCNTPYSGSKEKCNELYLEISKMFLSDSRINSDFLSTITSFTFLNEKRPEYNFYFFKFVDQSLWSIINHSKANNDVFVNVLNFYNKISRQDFLHFILKVKDIVKYISMKKDLSDECIILMISLLDELGFLDKKEKFDIITSMIGKDCSNEVLRKLFSTKGCFIFEKDDDLFLDNFNLFISRNLRVDLNEFVNFFSTIEDYYDKYPNDVVDACDKFFKCCDSEILFDFLESYEDLARANVVLNRKILSSLLENIGQDLIKLIRFKKLLVNFKDMVDEDIVAKSDSKCVQIFEHVRQEKDNSIDSLFQNLYDGVTVDLYGILLKNTKQGSSIFGHINPVFEKKFLDSMMLLDDDYIKISLKNIDIKYLNGFYKDGSFCLPNWYNLLLERCSNEPNKMHVLWFDGLSDVSEELRELIKNIISCREIKEGDEFVYKIPQNCSIICTDFKDESLSDFHIFEDIFDFKFDYSFDVKNWVLWALETNFKTGKLNIHPIVFSFLISMFMEGEFEDLDNNKDSNFEINFKRIEKLSNAIYLAQERGINNCYVSNARICEYLGDNLAPKFIEFYHNVSFDVNKVEQSSYTSEDFQDTKFKFLALSALISDTSFASDDELVLNFITNYLGKEYLSVYIEMRKQRDSVLLELSNKSKGKQ